MKWQDLPLTAFPPRAKGTYILVLHAARSQRIGIGRLGEQLIVAGYYGYVGSAFGPGGLAARLGHHARPPRRPHWHIDYLRSAAETVMTVFGVQAVRREHDWATVWAGLEGQKDGIAGFGASDCACATHLFYGEQPPDVAEFIRRCAQRFPADEPVRVIDQGPSAQP
ncbi:MAG: GIY-YIG nuclease family protein [Gammaproteobacteria bacterium]|nr:GIY-YIG nuclease family protein [Gammaproteobacteria bacterium]MCP5426076.1 GIY-YIG nuclease family protein [Gammaproteobacteria bacterium]